MKNRFWLNAFLLYIAVVLVIACAAMLASAQSTTQLSRRCPGASPSPARTKVEIEKDGDVALVPCSGKSVFVNGVASSGLITSLNGLTAASQTFAAPAANDTASWSSATSTHTLRLPITAVSGSSRTNYFPYFNAANTFARSGVTWNGTVYRWDNANDIPNATFTMNFTPQLSGNDGVFNVGAASSAQIIAAQSTSRITLTSPNLQISATNFTMFPTLTPGGTTGNQTINAALGTVNFAAAASSLTVTNSVVTATSLIFTQVLTNDATCSIKNVTRSSGSFVIRMTAACTAETEVAFWVLS